MRINNINNYNVSDIDYMHNWSAFVYTIADNIELVFICNAVFHCSYDVIDNRSIPISSGDYINKEIKFNYLSFVVAEMRDECKQNNENSMVVSL